MRERKWQNSAEPCPVSATAMPTSALGQTECPLFHMVWLQVMKAVSLVVIVGLHAIAFWGGAMPNDDQKIH